MSTVQFTIARSAADALPIESVLLRARAAGVPNARLEYSTVHAGVGKMRITCSVETATYLVQRLTEFAVSLESRNQAELIIECRYAVKARRELIEPRIAVQ